MRKLEYDWVRVFALTVVVLFHSTLPFTDQRWVINYAVVDPLPSGYLAWTAWRTALFFFISGIVGGLSAGESNDALAILRRLKRILIPLGFGVLIVVPPQIYFELLQRVNYQRDFISFLIFDCFRPRSICVEDSCVSLLAWKHLWYLGYLAVFNILASTMLAEKVRYVQLYVGNGANLLRFAAVLAIGVILILMARLLVWIKFEPVDLRFLPISAVAFSSLILYLLGRVLARAEMAWEWMGKYSVWLAMVCVLIYLAVDLGSSAFALSYVSYLGFGIFQYLTVLAIVGLFKRYINKDSALRRYSSQYVIVYFLWHQTIIVAFDYFWSKMSMPPPIAFFATIFAIFGLGWAICKLCDRIPVVALAHGVSPPRL